MLDLRVHLKNKHCEPSWELINQTENASYDDTSSDVANGGYLVQQERMDADFGPIGKIEDTDENGNDDVKQDLVAPKFGDFCEECGTRYTNVKARFCKKCGSPRERL